MHENAGCILCTHKKGLRRPFHESPQRTLSVRAQVGWRGPPLCATCVLRGLVPEAASPDRGFGPAETHRRPQRALQPCPSCSYVGAEQLLPAPKHHIYRLFAARQIIVRAFQWMCRSAKIARSLGEASPSATPNTPNTHTQAHRVTLETHRTAIPSCPVLRTSAAAWQV